MAALPRTVPGSRTSDRLPGPPVTSGLLHASRLPPTLLSLRGNVHARAWGAVRGWGAWGAARGGGGRGGRGERCGGVGGRGERRGPVQGSP